MGATLVDIIQSGVENLDSDVGLCAPDAEPYTLFAGLFNPVIEDYHGGFMATNKHSLTDFGDLSTLVNVDPRRPGYTFNPCLTEAQHREMEEKVSSTLRMLKGELKATYYPLTGMGKKTRQQLIDDHFLFKEGDRFLQAAIAAIKTKRYLISSGKQLGLEGEALTGWLDHERELSRQRAEGEREARAEDRNAAREVARAREEAECCLMELKIRLEETQLKLQEAQNVAPAPLVHRKVDQPFDRWVDLSETPKEFNELRNLLLTEQFIRGVPPKLSLFFRERKGKELSDIADLADRYLGETPFITGEITAKCMENPLYDVILGNIPAVRAPENPDLAWDLRKAEAAEEPSTEKKEEFPSPQPWRQRAKCCSWRHPLVQYPREFDWVRVRTDLHCGHYQLEC
ncbi:hypothetical protein HPB47_022610 [Ixodes persulcatus]|uniref:Uncharacterized protein n=1 Tax=Ixodes persulcatus TaxID=34615 RepID=A0AC60QBI2_IXOPE|nr:hypothetical protein HPB47_022610 [Ixodes persulcatus]